MEFVSRVRHGHINNVRSTFRRLEHIFPARIRNADHGQQSTALGDPAQVHSFREGDVSVFHLNPHHLKSETSADLDKHRIVEVHCGSEYGLGWVFLQETAYSCHGFSLPSASKGALG